jgi:hypothetical protein
MKYVGSAFFVGPTTLITAGHAAPTNNTEIFALYPGTYIVKSHPEDIFNGMVPDPKFSCRVLETLFKHSEELEHDIAILQVTGEYKAKEWLETDSGEFTKAWMSMYSAIRGTIH